MARTSQAHRISNVGRISCRITCHSASASRIVTVSAGFSPSAAAQPGSIARMPSTTNNHRVMSSLPGHIVAATAKVFPMPKRRLGGVCGAPIQISLVEEELFQHEQAETDDEGDQCPDEPLAHLTHFGSQVRNGPHCVIVALADV